jgi:Protein of unknown function (DUF3168)
MTSPIQSLKSAIRARLSADPAVLALLRAPKISDDPPREAALPHISFGAAEARENGTSSDEGHSTDLTLVVTARENGSAEALAIADAASTSLRGLPAALTGHRLVNLIIRAVEPQQVKSTPRVGETYRVLIRIRAVTEVL